MPREPFRGPLAPGDAHILELVHAIEEKARTMRGDGPPGTVMQVGPLSARFGLPMARLLFTPIRRSGQVPKALPVEGDESALREASGEAP